MLLDVKNLGKEVAGETLFSGVSFILDAHTRIAITGANGVGKTTLLRLVAGELDPDEGTIKMSKGLRVGYVPQESVLDDAQQVEALFPDIQPHIVMQFFADFGLEQEIFTKSVGVLSSGERTKIVLLSEILKKPDFLILDEPTNHIDITARVWLEKYLVAHSISALIVSHDRTFLDSVSTHILNIQKEESTFEKGTYSSFRIRVSEKRNKQARDYESDKDEYKRLKTSAEKQKLDAARGAKWAGKDGDKMLKGFKQDRSARSGSTAKALDSRRERIDMTEKPKKVRPLTLDIHNMYTGSGDIVLEEVEFERDVPILEKVGLHIPFGERVIFIGANGAGKSTLFNLITNIIIPTRGTVTVAPSIVFGNLTQDYDNLLSDKTPLVYLEEETTNDRETIITTLSAVGLEYSKMKQPLSTLSPGQRARVLLTSFQLNEVNALVLDEPTNHLDLEAVETFEEVLETFTGTILAVSHDRTFLASLNPDVVYEVKNKRVKKLPLTIAEYIEGVEKSIITVIDKSIRRV